MSIVDEQDLRQQLGRMLDAITPPEAPVSAAARKGKLIQARRSLGIVAGLAVAAGVGVGIPGLLNQPAREVSHARPTIVVEQTCTSALNSDRGTAGALGLVAARAGQPSAAEWSAGGRPAAEIAKRGCAWLKP